METKTATISLVTPDPPGYAQAVRNGREYNATAPKCAYCGFEDGWNNRGPLQEFASHKGGNRSYLYHQNCYRVGVPALAQSLRLTEEVEQSPQIAGATSEKDVFALGLWAGIEARDRKEPKVLRPTDLNAAYWWGKWWGYDLRSQGFKVSMDFETPAYAMYVEFRKNMLAMAPVTEAETTKSAYYRSKEVTANA